MPTFSLQQLRVHAIHHSLFSPTTLNAAIRRMGFVQADPIRSPARAQDLILRHRVNDYRAGDLERLYPKLNLDEDILYAYGFVTELVSRLLHPRKTPGMTDLEKKVLKVVTQYGRMHPRELEAHFGRERVVNAWGGYSKATKHSLERLHFRGLLRIAGRENGIRVYQAAPARTHEATPGERFSQLIMIAANIFGPMPQNSLQQSVRHFRRWLAAPHDAGAAIAALKKSGRLQQQSIDGLNYLWPAGKLAEDQPPRTVRFLAPFDPLVWDRRRFEHFWKWQYRFEAYTPPAKRIRGYYAMPMLWRDDIVGWANAAVNDGRLKIDVGFVNKRPNESGFSRELENEIERLKAFLNLP